MTNQGEQLKDWNCLLSFLADASDQRTNDSAPIVILAGNGLPILADKAAELYLQGQVQQIFLVGGIGHATKVLRQNFAKQGVLFEDGLSESEMCFRYLTEKYHIPTERFILETTSTNSGENAQHALTILQKKGALPERIFLMNDPTLQRRTRATFEKVWKGTGVEWCNYVPFVPQLIELAEELHFSQPELNDQWSKDYFYALVLGEIVRLKDDEQGYGPNGKNYMNHVDIPQKVWSAYQRIRSSVSGTFLRS